MALNSLKWKRAVRQTRKRLIAKNTAPVKTRDKGVVVSYTSGVSLMLHLNGDTSVEVPAHLVQCGGTPYVPAANDVVFVDNVDGVLVVMGKYIL